MYLENLTFRKFQDEDLPSAVLQAIGKRFMVEGKTISGQGRYFDNKSSQPAAVADKRQQVKVGSKSQIVRNIWGNMEFLKLLGGGKYQSFSETQQQVDEVEDGPTYKELKAEKGEPAGPRVGGDVSW